MDFCLLKVRRLCICFEARVESKHITVTFKAVKTLRVYELFVSLSSFVGQCKNINDGSCVWILSTR